MKKTNDPRRIDKRRTLKKEKKKKIFCFKHVSVR